MASPDYWIDPDELSQLGAELSGRPTADRRPTAKPGEDGPIDLFDLPEEASPPSSSPPPVNTEVERVGEQLAAIKKRALRSGVLRSNEDAAAAATGNPGQPLPGSGATLMERLESFVQWASRQDALAGLFISDFCGNELVDSGADEALVSSGVAVADGWRRAREELESSASNGVSTAASVRDQEGSVLTVFSCRSAYGNHVLGALSGQPLSPLLSTGMRDGFARVMTVL